MTSTRRLAASALRILLVSVTLVGILPAGAAAEQASQPSSTAARQLDSGLHHSCALLGDGGVRCWGYGADGQLGYGNTGTIGDNEAPGSAGPVNLGQGRSATAISVGAFHTCALLDNGSVRCWGLGADGRLGYGNTQSIGDNEPPATAGPVNLGENRTAKAISAGFGHTCAVLDNDTVLCWGYGFNGALGYAMGSSPGAVSDPNPVWPSPSIGDTEPPGSVGPVNLGEGRTAKAISAGREHTCALLNDDTVSCWGYGRDGRLGYGDRAFVGDNETPGSMGAVNVGMDRTASAISAGTLASCAVLDNAALRCWGEGIEGSLGYGNTGSVGANETPATVGPVNLGDGRSAQAISTGRHTCALLNLGAVRCWGANRHGQLGYGNTISIGDSEPPAAAGPVDLGAGRFALAISAGEQHTCARLDDGSVRCWGNGASGRLGLCDERNIGDDETPGSVAPVPLATSSCRGTAAVAVPVDSGGATPVADGLQAQAARRRGLRSCLSKTARHAGREVRRAKRLSGARRTRARRHIKRHRSQLRRRCLKRWGRTPGRVTGLTTRAVSRTKIVLSFRAPGTDGSRPPAARTYLVKQSLRPIRSSRAFRRAQTLCDGSCRLPSVAVGGRLGLTVTDLRPRTTYYYAVAARDNVSGRLGWRSSAVRVRTR